MKRTFVTIITFLMMSIPGTFAQKIANVKFEQTASCVGEFSENKPEVTSSFAFTNTGTAPLFFYRSIAPCGCTKAELPKEPVLPGEKGVIKITYNGKGKYPGYFKKSVVVFANTKQERYCLSVEGIMQAQRDE